MDLTNCPRCKKCYDGKDKTPKMLICHHTLCMSCVQSLAKGKTSQTVTCPECEKNTCIGRAGVSALPDNIYILPQLKNKTVDKNGVKDDVFLSDSEDEYEHQFVRGAESSASKKFDLKHSQVLVEEKCQERIFCKTCVALANKDCKKTHNICNYQTGISNLHERLKHATQGAGELLFNEISILEERGKLVDRISIAWNKISEKLEETRVRDGQSLSAAWDLYNHLPEMDEGVAKAKAGDPNCLSKTVFSTEKIKAESESRLTKLNHDMATWKFLTNCKVNLLSSERLPNQGSTTSFDFNLSDDSLPVTNDSTLCAMQALHQLLLENYHPPIKSKSKVPSADKAEKQNNKKTPTPDASKILQLTNVPAGSNKFQVVSKVQRPFSSHNKYCFMDLKLGNIDLGRVVFEIYCNMAPNSSKNFIDLCSGKNGFGYLNTKICRPFKKSYVMGGILQEGGNCSIYNKKPFLSDKTSIPDNVGMLRMRSIPSMQSSAGVYVGSAFYVWVEDCGFKHFHNTLVFGSVRQGLEILQKIHCIDGSINKDKLYIPSVVVGNCGILEN